jgi:hypothetical protein
LIAISSRSSVKAWFSAVSAAGALVPNCTCATFASACAQVTDSPVQSGLFGSRSKVTSVHVFGATAVVLAITAPGKLNVDATRRK